MITTKFWTILLLLISTAPYAGEKNIRVVKTQDAGSELQLEARQMPLASVLDKITEVTNVPIHYSVLPEGPVTAMCVGANVKQVLECLFNKKADLVFRYLHHPAKKNQPDCLAEVWVLGTYFDVEPGASTGYVSAKKSQYHTDAVANLAAQGQANDPAIYKALEFALSDENAEVRAQAVSGLARHEGYDASSVLQSALQDSDASVRLMAVDYAGDHPALLQQALGDSDETVRAYAAIKLEALSIHR